MKREALLGSIAGLIIGLGLGTGIKLARAFEGKPDLERQLLQNWINQGLERVLLKARHSGARPLMAQDRYVIFSDHHKGARNDADDFVPAEATYLAALEHYYHEAFTLIVMGDAEELWEERPQAVLTSYRHVFESEARFYPERYLRIHGNHDNLWQSAYQREKYLAPFFPGIEFYDGVLFTILDHRQQPCEILLVHGHQGTLESDTMASLSQFFVRNVYRLYQIATGLGRTTPAEDACLRALHDTMLYNWASSHERLILIAGHTHRPIWSSKTHLEKLLWQLRSLIEAEPEARTDAFEAKVETLREEIKVRARKYPPCNDSIKTRPCYFNTGCCRYADGDITGIELADGEIRLIKWSCRQGVGQRHVLESALLREVLLFL